MSEELRQLKLFIEAANQSNSSNDKLQVIRNFPQCQQLWKYAYDKINYRYGIKAKNIIKNESKLINQLSSAPSYNGIYELLDALNRKEVTGHDAIKSVLSFINRYPEYKDIVYNILDRNLKTRTDAKLFNKAFPNCIDVFDIALAIDIEEYDPNKEKINFQRDHWWASRKLDGIRCVMRRYNEIPTKFTSRGGLDFLTLDVLKQEFERFNLYGSAGDGEVCLIDAQGNEDFQRIMKFIRKKNYTIPTPRYCMFDYIPLEHFDKQYSPLTFEERQCQLENLISAFGNSRFITKVEQILVRDWDHLKELKDLAVSKNWEGLILRKNVPYEGTRSNDMLKVKVFIDAEFDVHDVEMGMIRYIDYDDSGKSYEKEEMMLSAIMIEYKNNIVRVGSGFDLSERKQFFADPSLILGKQVTVKYFQESINELGQYSLRFPTVKKIWLEGATREEEE